MTEPVNPEQVTAPAKPARTRSHPWALSLVLLLLIMMALGGVGYWFGWPWVQAQWQRLDGIENQLAALAAEKAQPLPDVPALARTAAETSVGNAVGKLEADWRRDLAAWQARQSAERAESTRQVSDRMSRVESQMDRLLAVDRRAWLGQEAVFLTRLAGQRLLVARDVEAALSLLQQADDLLRDTGEPRFESARLALARDRAALAAVPRVDQVGLYARLSALIEQMDSLQIAFQRETPPVPQADRAGEGLWEGVSARWQAALATLSDHLVIRHRSDDIAQLMTPEWAALARQNGRMLLEQAQIAMLSANQPLYEQSLARARDFVSVFREQDVDRVASILEEIAQLEQKAVSPDLPDLIESRSLLEAQIERLGREASG
jgi:uroporphyrin-3 C-methyltransferase